MVANARVRMRQGGDMFTGEAIGRVERSLSCA